MLTSHYRKWTSLSWLSIFTIGVGVGPLLLFIGILTQNGTAVAMGSYYSSIIVSALLWLRVKRDLSSGRSRLAYLVRLAFALNVGFAFYAGLIWTLWILKIPLNLSIVESGYIKEYGNMALFSIVLAGICYSDFDRF